MSLNPIRWVEAGADALWTWGVGKILGNWDGSIVGSGQTLTDD